MIFDVGANEGQTVRALAPAFPRAQIHSFEPDPGAFLRLREVARRFDSVHIHNVALGAEAGEAKLFRFAMDQTNSLLPKARGAELFVGDPEYLNEVGTTSVTVDTADAFCAAHAITRIDLLKTDAQGFDLEVLKGAEGLLDAGAVSLVYAEVCFVPQYEGQPLFPDIYQFLYARGFRLVGLYESGFVTHCYQVGGNGLFVHERLGPLKKRQARFRLGRVRILW